jgi:NADP-dependent 3-hydroxy acid dehydrogenase YdfG
MTVVMVSRSAAKLEAVKESVPGAVVWPCNVVDAEPVHHMANDIVERFGRIDVLANCAGVMYFTLLRNLQYAQWKQTIDTNCTGTVNVCGAVLPHMLSAKQGHIVNVSSDAARQVFPALAVYNASKAFVNTFSKSVRAECVGTGVRVTDIQPGDTATNLIMENTDSEAAGKVGVTIGEVVGTGFDRGSILDASDVARAIVYAISLPHHIGMHEILIEPVDQMYGDPTAMGVTPGGMYAPQFTTGPDSR